MKIELSSTTLSKSLFSFEPVQIESEETKCRNKLALEKLLASEPACNYVSEQQTEAVAVAEEEQEERTDIESSTISKHQLAEYRDAFSLFDKDQDGKISKEELRSVMLNLKQNIKLGELEVVLQEHNFQDEDISFEQFVQVLQATQVEQDLKDIFRVFDKRNMGYIYPSDLRAAWQSFGISLNDREIDEMISEVDTDGDGRISFTEFVNALNTHMVGENDDDPISYQSNI
ncbi:calmodulin-A-like [Planococcus citri]|uniref:calmodulin-A-like n=1 Tax=Planococcus citri TaxID=170843 RepID=UPI0031F91A58